MTLLVINHYDKETTFLPWNGKAVWPGKDKDHPWGIYNYFGVSDGTLARKVDADFAEIFQYDIQR